MELVEAIKTRRAIRKFKKEPVSRELLERLFEVSTMAPVVAQFRGWEFVVVNGGEMRDRIADILTQNTVILRDLFAMMDPDSEKKALEYYKNLGDVQTLIFVTIPKHPGQSNWEYAFKILTATTEFTEFWLLAHNEGLGACGITVPPYLGQQIEELLGIKDREIIYGMSLGYPDETPVLKPHPRVNVTYVG